MTKILATISLLGFVAMAVPASAETVVIHHGPMHHCRVVKTVSHGPMGRRVVVRKVCG